jgi:hypothetical protein
VRISVHKWPDRLSENRQASISLWSAKENRCLANHFQIITTTEKQLNTRYPVLG